MRRIRRAVSSGATATAITPTSAATRIEPPLIETTRPRSGSVSGRVSLTTQPITSRPPPIPSSVPSNPMIRLSPTASPTAPRTGTPKASIVAFSLARSSVLMLVELKAISRASASAKPTVSRITPMKSSRRSRTKSVVARARSTEAMPGVPKSSRAS